MKVDNEFTVSVGVERAWEVLTDLAGVSLCLPGARLTGVEGDLYRGEVRIKVGPVVSEYAGTAQFLQKDDAGHKAVIDAKGRDSRGSGNAAAVITVQLRSDGDHTVVSVDTDLKITGKIAQLGGGMIKEVSKNLLGQFVECLESRLAAPSEVSAAASRSEEAAATAPPEEAAATAPPEEEAVSAPSQAPAATQRSEPVDLLSLAGGAMLKRLVPVLVVVVAAVVVLVYLLAR
jgi:hypothetical protein